MSYDLKIINGDLVLKSGDFQKVENSEKLIQDILKICLTTVGSNPLNPWYGSYLSKSIVGTSVNPDIIISIGKTQLNNCLERLKELQQAQVKSHQRMTADEQLLNVQSVDIFNNQMDFRLYSVIIKVFTKGLQPISTSFKVSTI